MQNRSQQRFFFNIKLITLSWLARGSTILFALTLCIRDSYYPCYSVHVIKIKLHQFLNKAQQSLPLIESLLENQIQLSPKKGFLKGTGISL